jgi:tetratricopeptide (TPR) repeat protein
VIAKHQNAKLVTGPGPFLHAKTAMSYLKKLIHEIHRRSLWQVIVIYLGASWLVLQAVDTLTGALSLPDWAPPMALLALIVGFPIVLATAFVQEGMGGEARAESAAPVPDEAQEGTAPTASPPEIEVAESGEEIRPHHHIFTWRNALLGGAAAFTLLGVITAAWIIMRTLGIGPAGTLVAKGMLEERAPIVLAQFSAPDPSIATAATEALRIDLSQSDVIALVDPASLVKVLARMERSPDEKLTLETAREVAVREGYAAVIAGEITAVGNGYVLTSRIVDATSGQTLASDRQSAANADEIIPAIDRLSAHMRERVGESYSDLRADEPLRQVTTGSLEALQKYSEAIEIFDGGGDESLGNALLEEAVELDPGFAMAWRKLGVTRTGGRARRVEALEKAFEYRDRLTERERLHTEAIYYRMIPRDYQASITAYERLIELDPNDDWALNNIAVVYSDLGDYPLAEHYYERANAADSTSPLSFRNAAISEMNQGKLDEAEATLDAIYRKFPDNRTAAGLRVAVEANRGDYAAALAAAQRFDELPSAPATNMTKTSWLAAIAATQGRLADAETLAMESARHHEESGRSSPRLSMADFLVWVDLNVRQDTVRARNRLASYLRLDGFAESDPISRPYVQILDYLAQSGSRAEVEALIAEFESEVAEEYRQDLEDAYLGWEGALLAREGRYEEAIATFKERENRACTLCRYVPLAYVYDQAGVTDSAIAYYEGYIKAPGAFRLFWDSNSLGPALERLAVLHDEAGDLENAALYYARFVELWNEADPELQPRVEAAQQRLNEIFAARG